jgi:hypothetical protein
MRSRLTLGWLLAVFLARVSFGAACEAQVPLTSRPQSRSNVVVVKAAKQAFAPPLSQMTPLSPSSNGQRGDADGDVKPLHRLPGRRLVQDAALQSSHDEDALSTLSALSTNSGLNVLGIGNGFSGYSEQAVVPDTNVAVGPTQFVEFVNESFAVFNKSDGSVAYGPAGGNTLWQALGAPCSSNTNLDEIAQYDKLANRWVMLMPVFAAPSYLCVAVSTTSDAANGAWNLSAFELQLSPQCQCRLGLDYPKLGVWPDGYYISYNQGDNGNFAGAAACVVDRNSMLAGASASMQCFLNTTGTGNVSLLPADVDGTAPPATGTPGYFMNFDSNNQSLDLWQLQVDWATPANSTLSGPTNIPVAAFTEPCGETVVELNYTTGACIPQTGTSRTLDSYGDRLMYRLAYRNFASYQALLANHTVNTGSGTQTGVRWYELRDSGTGFSLYQQGTYAPDSNYRWMGSIAMDKLGDIALGYSVSGSGLSPSIRYTGRVPGDQLGTMESEIDMLSAAGVSPGSMTGTYRWGDYSSMAIDSSDDCTFWFASEYQPTTGTGWATRIGSFAFPSCVNSTPGFSITPSPSTAMVSAGGVATFNVAIASVGGFTNAVTLSCSAPTARGVGCSLSSTSANPGGTVTLTVTTPAIPAASRSMHPTHLYAAWIGSPLALVGIAWSGLKLKKRRLACMLLCLFSLGSMVLQTACGGSDSHIGASGTTYTVNISGVSGSIQHSVSVGVTVQ